MFILNYILAISFVVFSAAKTADLFILANKKIEQLQNNFVKTTKELIASPRGSVTIMAVGLTFVLSLLMIFYVKKMKIEYAEALYRKDSYLCVRYLNTETQTYIKEMQRLNLLLRAAFVAKNSVIASAEGEVAWQGLIVTRNFFHWGHLKTLSMNKFCGLLETFSYQHHLPFRTYATFNLETNIDETSIVRENQWNVIFYKKPINIRLKNSFCLKSTFHLDNAFTNGSSYHSEEIAITDLSSSNCFS